MRDTWSVCSLLLLTMADVCRGRNAADYFQEARFQNSPFRPEDALALFIANAPPVICEPDTRSRCYVPDYLQSGFCLYLTRGFSHYICSFEGNGTKNTNFELTEDIFYVIYKGISVRMFKEEKMYCTTDSQLPDEYFHMSIQRPHEDHLLKCHLLNDSGTFHLMFPGYPTITCYIGKEAGRYHFTLPGIDDAFKCSFRVYSELPLGDTRTEERLYQALIAGLPARVDGARPRVVCSRHAAINETVQFKLQLPSGATYNCNFPDAAVRCLAQSQYTPQN